MRTYKDNNIEYRIENKKGQIDCRGQLNRSEPPVPAVGRSVKTLSTSFNSVSIQHSQMRTRTSNQKAKQKLRINHNCKCQTFNSRFINQSFRAEVASFRAHMCQKKKGQRTVESKARLINLYNLRFLQCQKHSGYIEEDSINFSI